MGFDLSDVIGPARWIAEAEAATAKAAPDLPAWLPTSGIPALHFRDCSTVPALLDEDTRVLASGPRILLRVSGLIRNLSRPVAARRCAHAFELSSGCLDCLRYLTSSTPRALRPMPWRQLLALPLWWMYRSSKLPELREQVIAEMVQEKTGELLHPGSEAKECWPLPAAPIRSLPPTGYGGS